MIVGVVSSKGGTGKTSVSTHAADWFRIYGWEPYLFDVDQQRLAYGYSKDVGAEFEYGHVIDLPDPLSEGPTWVYNELPRLAAKYDVVIVDCPGGLNNFTGAVLKRADIALIPTPPGYMDLKGTEWTSKTIKQVQSQRDGLPKTGIIATQYAEGRRSYRTLERKARSLHFGFVESGIPQLEIIRTARGLPNEDDTGWESPPKLIWQMGKNKEVRKAARVFDSLFHEIFAGADKEDPMRIQRLVTPKSKWNELESWHKKPKEEDETRAAANS